MNANLKNLIADYSSNNDVHTSAKQQAQDKRDKIEAEIKKLMQSVTLKGMKNITAAHDRSMKFSYDGVQDVVFDVDEYFLMSNSIQSATIFTAFTFRVNRQSFGKYQELTSIFSGNTSEKIAKDCSTYGASADKLVQNIKTVAEVTQAAYAELTVHKPKILQDILDLRKQYFAKDESEVNPAITANDLKAKQEAIFEIVYHDVIEKLKNGVTFNETSIAHLKTNIEPYKEFLYYVGARPLISNFTEEVGFTNLKSSDNTPVYPLCWDKELSGSVQMHACKLQKVNAKSVSIIADEATKSSMSDLRSAKDGQMKWNSTFYTAYSGNRGNDYVSDVAKGRKGIKTATTIARLIMLAVAYEPTIIDNEAAKWMQTLKK